MNPRSQFLFGVYLPAEINLAILEFSVGGLSDGVCVEPMPAQWRLISRVWNEHATPFVYSSFSFHGSRSRIHALWKLLQMVVTRPDRAAMVRRLELTTMRLYEEFSINNSIDPHVLHIMRGYVRDPQAGEETFLHIRAHYSQAKCRIPPEHSERIKRWHYRKLYKENQAWLDKAMTDVGFDQGLKSLAGELLSQDQPSDEYQCPLSALLLAYCPNIRWLTIHNHLPSMDPWLTRVLGYAVGKDTDLLCLDHDPMQMVTVLRVAPRLHRMARCRPSNVLSPYPCVINEDYRPYHRLPRLKQFVGCGVSFCPSVGQTKDAEQPPSNIESLFLFGTGIRGLQLRGLLQFSPRLRSFALQLPGNECSISNRREVNDASFILSLWSMLDHFKDQLEYLDICYGSLDPRKFNRWFRAGTPFCCPLAQFPKLRQLSIPIFLILGYNCQHGGSLANHLPPNIVLLYLDTTNEGRFCFQTFRHKHGLYPWYPFKDPSRTLRTLDFDRGVDMRQLCCLEEKSVGSQGLVKMQYGRNLLFNTAPFDLTICPAGAWLW